MKKAEKIVSDYFKIDKRDNEFEQLVSYTNYLLEGMIDTEGVKSIELVAQERLGQINKHGFDSEHDADTFHQNEELLGAALFCLVDAGFLYPYTWQGHFKILIRKKPKIKRLITSSALIMAEIDRLLNKK